MKYTFSILIVAFLASCRTGGDFNTKIFEALQKLEAGSMLVDVDIDDEKFYPPDLPFKGTITLNDQACFVNLRNPEGGNIVISMEEKDWYKSERKKIDFKEGMPETGNLYGSFLIGRRQGNTGEGYLLREGYYEIVQMNQEACIITVEGLLQNPFNDQIIKPVKGFIVWKKPTELSTEAVGDYLFN